MRETPNLRTEENERRKIRRERKEEKMKFRRRKDRKIVLIRVLLLFASALRGFGPKDEIKKIVVVVVDCEDAHYPQTHTAETQRYGTIYRGSARNVIENMAASRQCGS
jgi:2-C-methyl-D-erythritol 4-phosphate cytidylyltransferase